MTMYLRNQTKNVDGPRNKDANGTHGSVIYFRNHDVNVYVPNPILDEAGNVIKEAGWHKTYAAGKLEEEHIKEVGSLIYPTSRHNVLAKNYDPNDPLTTTMRGEKRKDANGDYIKDPTQTYKKGEKKGQPKDKLFPTNGNEYDTFEILFDPEDVDTPEKRAAIMETVLKWSETCATVDTVPLIDKGNGNTPILDDDGHVVFTNPDGNYDRTALVQDWHMDTDQPHIRVAVSRVLYRDGHPIRMADTSNAGEMRKMTSQLLDAIAIRHNMGVSSDIRAAKEVHKRREYAPGVEDLGDMPPPPSDDLVEDFEEVAPEATTEQPEAEVSQEQEAPAPQEPQEVEVEAEVDQVVDGDARRQAAEAASQQAWKPKYKLPSEEEASLVLQTTQAMYQELEQKRATFEALDTFRKTKANLDDAMQQIEDNARLLNDKNIIIDRKDSIIEQQRERIVEQEEQIAHNLKAVEEKEELEVQLEEANTSIADLEADLVSAQSATEQAQENNSKMVANMAKQKADNDAAIAALKEKHQIEIAALTAALKAVQGVQAQPPVQPEAEATADKESQEEYEARVFDAIHNREYKDLNDVEKAFADKMADKYEQFDYTEVKEDERIELLKSHRALFRADVSIYNELMEQAEREVQMRKDHEAKWLEAERKAEERLAQDEEYPDDMAGENAFAQAGMQYENVKALLGRVREIVEAVEALPKDERQGEVWEALKADAMSLQDDFSNLDISMLPAEDLEEFTTETNSLLESFSPVEKVEQDAEFEPSNGMYQRYFDRPDASEFKQFTGIQKAYFKAFGANINAADIDGMRVFIDKDKGSKHIFDNKAGMSISVNKDSITVEMPKDNEEAQRKMVALSIIAAIDSGLKLDTIEVSGNKKYAKMVNEEIDKLKADIEFKQSGYKGDKELKFETSGFKHNLKAINASVKEAAEQEKRDTLKLGDVLIEHSDGKKSLEDIIDLVREGKKEYYKQLKKTVGKKTDKDILYRPRLKCFDIDLGKGTIIRDSGNTAEIIKPTEDSVKVVAAIAKANEITSVIITCDAEEEAQHIKELMQNLGLNAETRREVEAEQVIANQQTQEYDQELEAEADNEKDNSLDND